MNGYLTTIFLASATISLAGYVFASKKEEKVAKVALGIILVSAIISPLISLCRGLAELPEYSDSAKDDVFEKTAEEAFCNGVELALAEHFSLEVEQITVLAEGFSAEKLRARTLTVYLGGSARLADYRAIIEFVVENNFGECEVKLQRE